MLESEPEMLVTVMATFINPTETPVHGSVTPDAEVAAPRFISCDKIEQPLSDDELELLDDALLELLDDELELRDDDELELLDDDELELLDDELLELLELLDDEEQAPDVNHDSGTVKQPCEPSQRVMQTFTVGTPLRPRPVQMPPLKVLPIESVPQTPTYVPPLIEKDG